MGRYVYAITPDGRLIRTPNTPTLMDFPAHTVVLPDAEKAAQMTTQFIQTGLSEFPSISTFSNDNSLRHEIMKFRIDATRLLQKIEEKETIQPFIKDGDIRAMVKKGASWVNYLNGRL